MRSFPLLSLAACAFAVALGASTACVPQVSTGAGDAGSTSSATSTPDAAAATVTGSGCVKDANTGAELCTATSMCPQTAIDTQTFPDCGFQVVGSSVEIQCVCNGMLCPLGTPHTCADVTALLSQQTEAEVCTQLSDGRCTGGTSSSSSSSSSSGASTSCDQSCLATCGQTSACYQICC